MKLRSVFILSVAASALPACSKKAKPADKEPAKPAATVDATEATAPPTTPPTTGQVTPPTPAGDGKPFEATLEGKTYKFASVKINDNTQNESLRLSTAAGGCDVRSKPGDTTLEVLIESGPGGKHYAPGPLGVSVLLINEKEKFSGRHIKGVLTLEPGEWKVGNKVKGTLRMDDIGWTDPKDKKAYTGAGAFEAEVCSVAGENRFQDTPESADKGPATGTLGTEKFTFKSGIALLSHDEDRNLDQIAEIHLFDSAVDCTAVGSLSEQKGAHVMLSGNEGSVGKDVFIGVPQQRQLYYYTGGDQQGFLGPVWVKFDALELKDGTEMMGSVHAEASAPVVKDDPTKAGRLSGSFTAKICKF